ncbi:unnamed protein product [Kuraishia capsulata CBS 1993]|uniref:ATP-dependent (S)-NAD(P)H-hydrate dehydratase n=1 Tax=Kuraishia capsulata CBS 1993 TaxID=1382522 RepID=W6MU44_9ASCO|nr:uncharacterized protein KUCA_T00006048001 [Kuraishia capsulata CBS 1993]CDK30053.1 unnamed protein product [Kuraishia capsulata CBS 1993]
MAFVLTSYSGQNCGNRRSHSYTGAPFFSAHAAALLGVDLTHVICEESAAPIIKSYSPDLMVHPYLKDSSKLPEGAERAKFIDIHVLPKVRALLQRIHVVVVGPGLGRDPAMLETLRLIVRELREREIPVIMDADSLFLLSEDPDILKGYGRAIITPNVVEFARICKALEIDPEDPKAAIKVSKSLGDVVVFQKGAIDKIVSGDLSISVDEEGSNKRVGGQGDSLTGLISGFVAWGFGAYKNRLYPESKNEPFLTEQDILMTACFGGSITNRRSANLAFKEHGRALQTSDIHKFIPSAYRELFE